MAKGILILCVVAGVLVFIFWRGDPEGKAQEKLDKVRIGMTNEAVMEIFQDEGAPSAPETPGFVPTKTQFFVSPGNKEKYVEVTFDEDGKVSSKKGIGF